MIKGCQINGISVKNNSVQLPQPTSTDKGFNEKVFLSCFKHFQGILRQLKQCYIKRI